MTGSTKMDLPYQDLSLGFVKLRPSLAICVVDPKFAPFYTNQGLELHNKRIRDGMRQDNFKITRQTKEAFDFHKAFNKRFGNAVLASSE